MNIQETQTESNFLRVCYFPGVNSGIPLYKIVMRDIVAYQSGQLADLLEKVTSISNTLMELKYMSYRILALLYTA